MGGLLTSCNSIQSNYICYVVAMFTLNKYSKTFESLMKTGDSGLQKDLGLPREDLVITYYSLRYL